MRRISKREQPVELVDWRSQRQRDNDPIRWPFTYEAMRRSADVLEQVEDGLFGEQGGICAYTGRKIERRLATAKAGFHIEHLKPQNHCDKAIGEDTLYTNMVACWPEPNQRSSIEYGAAQKDNWPSPAEMDDFVSPLSDNCSTRFRYENRADRAESDETDYSNWIEPATDDDNAAITTIGRINLNHSELRSLRYDAIIGALNPSGSAYLTIAELESLGDSMDESERELDQGRDVELDPYCSAIRQAIARRIRRLGDA